jgi:hypothetical protein
MNQDNSKRYLQEHSKGSLRLVDLDLRAFVELFDTRQFGFIGQSYLTAKQRVFSITSGSENDEKEARYQSLLMNEFPDNIHHVYYFENGNEYRPWSILGKMGHYYFYFQAPFTPDGKMSHRHPIKCFMSRIMYDEEDTTGKCLQVPQAFYRRAVKYQSILQTVDPTLQIERFWKRASLK